MRLALVVLLMATAPAHAGDGKDLGPRIKKLLRDIKTARALICGRHLDSSALDDLSLPGHTHGDRARGARIIGHGSDGRPRYSAYSDRLANDDDDNDDVER